MSSSPSSTRLDASEGAAESPLDRLRRVSALWQENVEKFGADVYGERISVQGYDLATLLLILAQQPAAPALEGARDATGVLRTEEAPSSILSDEFKSALQRVRGGIPNEGVYLDDDACYDLNEGISLLCSRFAASSSSVREDGSDADLANEMLSDEATDHMLRELDESAGGQVIDLMEALKASLALRPARSEGAPK